MTKFDGYSETMTVDGNGRLVAGDVVIDGIERSEVLFALNAYKNTKQTVIVAAKLLVWSALIIGIMTLMYITDIPTLK